MAATSLSGAGPVSATCIGFSGININLGGGGGCNSTFGNFALGLGANTVADASGGFLNGAIAIGTNVGAFAEGSGFSVANVALNFGSADDPIDPATGIETGPAFSRVTAGAGFLNLGANLTGAANAGGGAGPTPIDIRASGIASSVINAIGANRNTLTSEGILANITVLGTIFAGPNGSDNIVTSTGPVSVAFVRQGIFSEECTVATCGNEVHVTGPFALGGAFNTVKRTVIAGPGNRINIAFPFNDTGTMTNLSVAGGPQAERVSNNVFAPDGASRNLLRSSLNAAFDRPKTPSSGGSLKSVSDRITSSIKKLSDRINNVTRGLTEGPKAGPETTKSE